MQSLQIYFSSSLKQRLTSMPANFVTVVPFILLVVLLVLVLIFLYRTREELASNQQLRDQLQFHTTLANEKSNFLRLISHFFRKPMSAITGGVEMAKADLSPANHTALLASANDLHTTIEKLVSRIESDQALRQIQSEPVWQGRSIDTVRNRLFAMPVVGLLVLLAVFNGIFLFVHSKSVSYINLGVQLVMFAVVSSLLYATLRNNSAMRHENERIIALTKFQRRLDTMRSTFIHEAQYSLMYAVMKLQENVKPIQNAEYRSYIMGGINRYNELIGKLRLASQLENTKVSVTPELVSFNGVIADAIKQNINLIQTKQLSMDIEAGSESPQVEIDNSMLLQAVNAMLTNAINTSLDRTRVEIRTESNKVLSRLQVIDHGQGMSKEQLESLSSIAAHGNDDDTSEQAVISLNLYIARMIAHAFNGELLIESREGKGTVTALSLPVAK